MNVAHELDIVRENERLSFPPNVELNFVYWSHTEDNLSHLIPHLETADAVAQETASIPEREGMNVRTMAKAYERAVNHEIQGIATEQQQKLLGTFDDFSIERVKMLTALPNKPRFFLVDDFMGRTDEDEQQTMQAFSHHQLDGEQYLTDNLDFYTGYFSHREGVTLAQLAMIARKLGRSGEQKQLAVIYGSHHTALSVAARALGANVTRTFATPRLQSTIPQVVSKMIRYNRLPHYEDMTIEQRDTIMAAIAIDAATAHGRATGSPRLKSAAGVLRAVADLDPEVRDDLWVKARNINEYSRQRHYKDKKLAGGSKLRILRHIPTMVRFAAKAMSFEDEFVSAHRQQLAQAKQVEPAV